MPRIRTVKPEFWEDEVVGLLPRDARLLFIATFNMADDEGLLRWTPAYIKAQAFMYDDDLSVNQVGKLMQCLADAGLVFPYIGGVARQQMACVVNFRKHQKINRPQRGKLPPPSLQSAEVRRMYARRDNWVCQLCGNDIPQLPVSNDSHNLSIDHIRHQGGGGTDHPSNVRASHQACNKSRRDGPDDEFVPPRSLACLADSLNDALNRSVNGSLNYSVNESQHNVTSDSFFSTDSDISSVSDSLSSSVMEGKGREGKGKEEEKEDAEPPASADSPPRADVEQVCQHLAAVLEKTGSKKSEISSKWRNDARLMIDRDKITVDQAITAIDWAHADDFWQAHILSPGKLRAKFETLRRQAMAEQRKRAPQGPPTAPREMTEEEKKDALKFG